ncbi:RELT-like protein 1 isoform X2 [Spea bombifrons]|uniref:RELT-like protein 1 isoform X2 n=1 Tax=Spea bombifrons TaxID=233779 RepID=UPI002349491F|nr:RELT-like protein 1 isoform X2 [Spea bombifrons]XP_053314334.1 RELT-like protein 1 isoform X2 [Spea bombifrons]
MSPVSESLLWPQAGAARWRLPRSADDQVLNDVGTKAGDSGNATDGTGHPEYVAFVLVPVFFVMGLLGVLICHILKKKGYRCTTEAEPDVEEKVAGEKIEMHESVGDTNNDTVGQIVSYIMKNEANADVLKAMVADNSMLGDNSVFDPESPTTPNTPVSPSTPVSPATPSKHSCRGHHLHTIGGVADKNACTRCGNKRWLLMKSPPKNKEPKKPRQSVTVLSVGRFRVTKVEPKSKERKRLMSDGTEVTNGEAPSTPVAVDTRQRDGTETENRSSIDT